MTSVPELMIAGIEPIEAMELSEDLPEGSVRLSSIAEAPRPAASEHGEPLTLTAAVVAITVPAIHALATWLAKRRISTTQEQELRLERWPDGRTVLTIRGQFHQTATEPADPAVVESFAGQLQALLSGNP